MQQLKKGIIPTKRADLMQQLMTGKNGKLLCAIEGLKVHDHICSVYETADEQKMAVIPYISNGLRQNEKCVYIADENPLDEVIDFLKAEIPGVPEALRNGSLIIIGKEDSYLRPGYFDPEWMMNFLVEQVSLAKQQGFSALRVTGEASWALCDNLMTRQLIEYESKVNHLLSCYDVSALCQYNRKDFAPEVVKSVLETHPTVIYKGTVCKNYHYIPTEEFLSEHSRHDEATRMLNQLLLIENYVDSLKESEERLRRAVINAPLPVMIATRDDGRVLQLNRQWSDVTGYTLNDIPTLEVWMEKAYGRRKEDIDRKGRERFSTSEISDLGIYTIRIKSGESRIWEFFSSPLGKSFDGEEIIILTAVDITELKEKENELIQAKNQAEESVRLKSEFLAQMSHEIRTPINTILNYISLIKEMSGEIKNPDLDYSFHAIDSSSRRLIRTIDLILNASQLQTGKYECEFRKMDLEMEVLIPIVREMQSSAAAKGIRLYYEGGAAIPPITADEYTVTQIFQNLIDNAIKYTPAGEVKVSASVNEAGIEVAVTDTGIGISPEFIDRLFDPFTQEEQGYTRKYEGSGLGLALVEGYCRLNNARVKVKSEKGEGTSFTVIFPK